MHIRRRIAKITSTFFYAGFFPFVPGTFASIVGIVLFYLLRTNLVLYAITCFCLILLGFLTSTDAEGLFQQKDPKFVVIDEVAGVFISFALLPYYDMKVWIIGFLMFRILDTLKVFPAGRIQNLKGSLGIMGDDIIAGVYTNIILQVIFRFAVFKIS